MNRFQTTLATACLALSASLAFAQAPAGGDAGKGPGMMGGGHHRNMKPCSQETDPAKCEATRKQMRENMKAAHDACKDAKDKRGCMSENYCAKAADPAQCKAKAAEMKQKHAQHRDQRQAVAEACTGKRGDALDQCYREQGEKMRGREKHGHDKKG
jgi:Spy/CpxP family protein refolding chaperone